MDHYEELGIKGDASEDEIRQAHRRLAKLLHPDQQTDEGMKLLAETQMRRLNSIVAILVDPERRRQYDTQLKEGFPGVGPGGLNARSPASCRTLRSVPWWVGSTVGGVLLTVGVAWFWADHWGSSFGNHVPTYIPSQNQENDADAKRSFASDIRPPVPANSRPVPPRKQMTARFRSRTVAPVFAPQIQTKAPAPAHKTLSLPATPVLAPQTTAEIQVPPPPRIAEVSISRVEAATNSTALLPSTPKPPEPPTTSQNPLEGEWVYAPKQPEKRKPGLYPPEFIHLKLFWNDGGLHGQYRAKYQVSDKPIPPVVNLILSPDNSDHRFMWQSGNGSRGTLKISSIDASSIRVEWRTTVFSREPGLTAGMATLVRRSQ